MIGVAIDILIVEGGQTNCDKIFAHSHHGVDCKTIHSILSDVVALVDFKGVQG